MSHKLIGTLMFLLFCSSNVFAGDPAADPAKDVSEAQKEEASYAETIENFKKASQTKPFFAEAYGYAVFPTIGKGGFVVGGAYGEGRVYKKGKMAGKTEMTQITAGLQLGGQAFSQIIFFKDEAAYNDFIKGNFEFGAGASAVAITYGTTAQATTTGASASAGKTQSDAVYNNGMAIFTHAKGGLMYEASIGGQKFSFTPVL